MPSHRRRGVDSAASGQSSSSTSSSNSSSTYFAGQRKQSRQKKLYKMLTATATTAVNAVPMDPTPQTAYPVSFDYQQYEHPSVVTAASNRVPLLSSPELQLRFLAPSDLPEVKKLCKEWFPIDYPDVWYDDITSNPKFYSYACCYHGRIIGLVVAEIRDFWKLPKEDSELLASTFGHGTKIAYILSLGVLKEYRSNGVASFMLGNLLSHLRSGDHRDVRAVYLHVLTTNNAAITFYEHRGFKPHLFLPYYYNIKGRRRDGFTYVLYINGGHPPWSALDYMIHCCQLALLLNPWRLTKTALRKVAIAWLHLLPRVRQVAQSSTAIFS